MRGQRSTQLFERQDGVATRSQLLAAGVGEDAVDHRLKTGRYRVEHEGVYSLGPLSMRGRLQAALLAGGGDAHLCHASALVPHKLRTTVVTIDLGLPRKRRDTDKLRFHRLSLADSEVTKRDGLRVTTIERTLFDIAATGADVRRLAQEALAKRMTTRKRLSEFAVRHRGERGAPAIRRVAGEPHTRSNLERRFLRFLDANGFPPPLANQPIGEYDVDCYWPQFGLAGLGLRTMRVTEESLREDGRLREEVRRAARIVP